MTVAAVMKIERVRMGGSLHRRTDPTDLTDLSVNACGNTVNVVGLLNPAAGNTCVSK